MKHIAIIGSGIAGLTCAHLLSKHHRVTVFEANDYIGGHTATVDIELNGRQWAIDTGFIVFNDRTYPNFLNLMKGIDITPMPTQMSFSVQNLNSGLEYNGHGFFSLFAQKRNWLRPAFWRFLAEIVRFNHKANGLYQDEREHGVVMDADYTLGQFLHDAGFSRFFAEHYILPMGAAIWSASLDDMQAFPLAFFIRFFHHHGLLNITNRPQWYVLNGGSRSYIPGLIAPFKEQIRLNTQVLGIRRLQDGVEVRSRFGVEKFDDVVLACHSDQALEMLTDASDHERSILGAMTYQDNEVVLHTDRGMLPQRRAAWASWNYRLDGDSSRLACVTYNMNILQRLPAQAPTFCVTLNQTDAIKPDAILRCFTYAHPVFTRASQIAQLRRNEICGQQHTYFAGAYWHNGFHEDGVKSALEVCRKFNLELDAEGRVCELTSQGQLSGEENLSEPQQASKHDGKTAA
ncbi:amine oxidase [Shewanella sp. NFH-SH190041]|uniref:NAD(P)/FAD-dependent oxidoreductase n=1 Tax=Shewanella sp. NFH-SH190041 TaxID=2950245 RepID=UPI0021C25D53|nr:FAD-dependent oxidoreductase [Shewanella sp. NFH-SH190041]BDM63537.1 amine oxidase [Shewanella sp. NFH-SH190041]